MVYCQWVATYTVMGKRVQKRGKAPRRPSPPPQLVAQPASVDDSEEDYRALAARLDALEREAAERAAGLGDGGSTSNAPVIPRRSARQGRGANLARMLASRVTALENKRKRPTATAAPGGDSDSATERGLIQAQVGPIEGPDPKEDLLGLLPLKGQTCGEDIANAVIECIEKHHIPLDKIFSISTDGAKSMTGIRNGFVAILKEKINHEIPLHHSSRSALCADISSRNLQRYGIGD